MTTYVVVVIALADRLARAPRRVMDSLHCRTRRSLVVWDKAREYGSSVFPDKLKRGGSCACVGCSCWAPGGMLVCWAGRDGRGADTQLKQLLVIGLHALALALSLRRYLCSLCTRPIDRS